MSASQICQSPDCTTNRRRPIGAICIDNSYSFAGCLVKNVKIIKKSKIFINFFSDIINRVATKWLSVKREAVLPRRLEELYLLDYHKNFKTLKFVFYNEFEILKFSTKRICVFVLTTKIYFTFTVQI